MSARAQLEIEGSLLGPGESVRMVCPFCGGGTTSEASLVLTHCPDGGLLFVCHRAHCTARGRIGGAASGPARVRPAPTRRASEFVPGPGTAVPDGLVSWLLSEWHFARLPMGWHWNEVSGRLMMQVKSPKAERRGWVGRAFRGGPKTMNDKEVYDQPWVHWAGVFAGNGPVYIVEDIPSAERLRERGVTACALMGVHASDDVVGEIVEVAARTRSPVIIALDRDAVSNAFALRDRLFHRTEGKVIVAVLKDVDVKNMKPEELADWLNVGF